MDDMHLSKIDGFLMERYFQNVIFPISQEDLMQVVRSHDAPQELIEQMEQMLRSDQFESLEHIENELGGMYNDGEAVSMDGDLA